MEKTISGADICECKHERERHTILGCRKCKCKKFVEVQKR